MSFEGSFQPKTLCDSMKERQTSEGKRKILAKIQSGVLGYVGIKHMTKEEHSKQSQKN